MPTLLENGCLRIADWCMYVQTYNHETTGGILITDMFDATLAAHLHGTY